MRALDVRHALSRRLRRPGLWLGATGLGLLWALVRLHLPVPYGRYGLGEAWLPGLALLLLVLLGPVPWQWTGDDRPVAPAARGCLQGLVFHGAWALLFLLGVGLLLPPRGPRPGPPPFPPPDAAWRPPGPPPPAFRPRPHLRGPAGGALDGVALFHAFLLLLSALGLGRVLADQEADARRAEASEALALAARAQALQAQLHPHALFNALSGLTELVHEDPEAAEAALITLTDFLRRLMRQGAQAATPLAEERALVELQLRLAELRLGPRLQAEWDWPDWAGAQPTPPLLLQPLVENALEHGIARRTAGGRLRLRAAREDGGLVLEVANTGELADSPGREGTGLRNLRERLALLRPAGRLELAQRGGWTVARIHLPETP
ncbi:MAG TPA: histidine kinase [Holophagaceae bacterium]|nr:histidine kinase [Holophagaceae bacterium]